MKKVVLAIMLALVTGVSFGQMKIGSNPSTINKSSILELESTKQGLLLPRVPGSNLGVSPLNAAPDGMIVYVIDSSALCVRRNGVWLKMSLDIVANSNWTLNGNAGTNEATNFIGTTDGQGVVFKANNNALLKLTSTGNIQVPNNTTTLPVVPSTDQTQVQVLLVDPATGNILQRKIALSAFSNAIVSLGNLRDSVHEFATSNIPDTGITIKSSSNGAGTATHTLNIPIQDGSAATNAKGLLTYADWVRFDANAKAAIVDGAFSASSISTGVTIDPNTDPLKPGTQVVTLHAANASNPGGVSIADQTFGGSKNFRDSLAVGLAANTYATSTFEVNGSIASNITTMTTSGAIDEKSNTILATPGASAMTITLPSPTNIKGRMYTIKKVGSGDPDGGIDSPVTIATTGGTIDGGANYVIYNDWTFVTLQTDGTNWYIIKK
ncbi:hypothetical protein QTN47_19335 [Danxiaibacter flavus]|uniref:Uncharacterized protein n=1 Tax=Danxiaibacter flavus TaxID=3049108 RepID=A0ABV3ZIE7_9BACT|nr:hypothetical protein QNM32_19345 [Chitinophagaceae bacterium DXS]